MPPRSALAETPLPPAKKPEPEPVARRLSAADAAVADNWRPATGAPPRTDPARSGSASSDVRRAAGDERRIPTPPEPHSMPPLRPVDPTAYRAVIADPAATRTRGDDAPALRARPDDSTPEHTPWSRGAPYVAADESTVSRFPSLPDEVSSGTTLPWQEVRTSTSAPTVPSSSRSPFIPARPLHDPRDPVGPVGAWPTLPGARTSSIGVASAGPTHAAPDADRWPELPGDESDEGNDPDLSLPADHRGRLEREQRGLSWNG